MERKIKDLMQIIDDELDHHPKHAIHRDYKIYDGAFASRIENHPPYITLKIKNPRGRAKPTYEDMHAEFQIILDLYQIPAIPEHIYPFEKNMKHLGFEIPPIDLAGRCYGSQPGDQYSGSVKGKLTLANYQTVFRAITEAFSTALERKHKFMRPFGAAEKDHRGWMLKQLKESTEHLFGIFKKVYAGEKQALKRRKLF